MIGVAHSRVPSSALIFAQFIDEMLSHRRGALTVTPQNALFPLIQLSTLTKTMVHDYVLLY